MALFSGYFCLPSFTFKSLCLKKKKKETQIIKEKSQSTSLGLAVFSIWQTMTILNFEFQVD